MSDKQKDGGEKEYVCAPISLAVCNDNEVMMSTAVILVKNEKTNAMHEARCYLDCGSQSNFISEALVEKLGMQGEDINVNITGIKDISFDVKKHCAVTIQPRNRSVNGPCARVDAYILSQIMKPLPSEEVDISDIDIPQNITLADPGWYKPAEIDILIGGAIFWDLIRNGQIELGRNKPKLQNSIFGWLVVGKKMLTTKSSKTKTEHCGFSREISDQLSKFWELEEVPAAPVLSPEEAACEEHFKQNTRRLADGRYCVTLPLKNQPDVLGDSYRLARKRFDSLEHRFRRQPDVKSQYVDFINEYAQLNHLSESKKPEKGHFLPHHPILKEQSESTKCRVVFDGSARTDSGYSLNDILMQRTRWQQRRPDIKPGQMVLIKDEATSPLKWPLGRIQTVYPGSDGASRVANILTTKGTIRRAINRICPFLDEDKA
ncbi:uncharacterized protein LOC134801361 [Cydia splendana]|uniref:uncharacterized protein LOC134801361 n=1 Tax=Cydia splendana TaxID=1100963 RepID=UPI00300D93C4